MHDSRRYHRRRSPAFTRHQASGGFSSSNPVLFDPFGSTPFRQAGMEANQFTNPTGAQLGFGGGPNSPYAAGQGPYGQYLSQVQPTLSSYLPNMTNLSSTLTTGANSAFGGYQAAVDNFMNQLPGFQSSMASATGGASGALGAANTALSDAMSPLQSRASYQEGAQRALDAARPGEAARGMVEGGQAQSGEQNLLGTLAYNTMQSDKANQQAAIQGVTGASGALSSAAGNQANLGALGPQMMQSLFAAYPQLASILTSATQMPFQAGSDLMNYFQSAQNPIMSLLNMVKPQMGQHSFSFNQSAGI
jgi:hypothetical protein